mmetsp:Transcript_44642/g.136174  ORF Transcript_44642/g.136174 Transcript_44642/m.136174 type:complete len:83 (+) Transcript_44642:205-453(+)
MLFNSTYLGHRFLIEDPETEEVVMEHVVEFNGVRTIGQHPSLIDRSTNHTNRIRFGHDNQWNQHKKSDEDVYKTRIRKRSPS